MKVTLPADCASAIEQVGGIAALLDKNGWKAAALIAVSVEPGIGSGAGNPVQLNRVSCNEFAKHLNVRGWSRNTVQRYYTAWEHAANAGVVKHAADLDYGDKIDVPDDDWQSYYAPPPLPTPPPSGLVSVPGAPPGPVAAATAASPLPRPAAVTPAPLKCADDMLAAWDGNALCDLLDEASFEPTDRARIAWLIDALIADLTRARSIVGAP